MGIFIDQMEQSVHDLDFLMKKCTHEYETCLLGMLAAIADSLPASWER